MLCVAVRAMVWIAPVAGSRRIEAMREAVAALEVKLDAQDWTEIWAAGSGHEVP